MIDLLWCILLFIFLVAVTWVAAWCAAVFLGATLIYCGLAVAHAFDCVVHRRAESGDPPHGRAPRCGLPEQWP